jgi:hypothetical protein
MNTKLVVLRNGKPLFEYPIELDADVGLAVGVTMALSEFHRLNPTISLLDPKISIRFKNSSELHCPAPTPAIRGSVTANSLFLEKFSLIHLWKFPVTQWAPLLLVGRGGGS